MNATRAMFAAALGAASLWAAQPASAQSYLTPAAPIKGVSLEASYTDFEMLEGSFPSTVLFLSGRLPLGPRLRVVADVPFAHASADLGELGEESSDVLGNPLLGLEYVATDRLVLEVSTRAPLTTADSESFADVFGALSDLHRAEAFLEDVVPVTGAVAYEQPLLANASLRARGGLTAAISTGDSSEETETWADYGVLGSYRLGSARLGAGVSGRWLASSDEGDFADNSVHQLGFSADFLVAGIRPGVSLRLPLDDEFSEYLDYTIGLYLQMPLR